MTGPGKREDREDRIVWQQRTDGGADADLDLVAPSDLPDADIEVGAAEVRDGRIRVHLRLRPAAG